LFCVLILLLQVAYGLRLFMLLGISVALRAERIQSPDPGNITPNDPCIAQGFRSDNFRSPWRPRARPAVRQTLNL
jgi:hypothetical protein